MCGITGLILSDGVIQKHNLSDMISSLSHRGPDSNGIWINENQNFGIGHTRLSILDLSSAGSQPMHSKNNRYIISFNGEIYNHLDIRLDLKKEYPSLEFVGSSDTETILACIEKWGLSKSLKKMKGMFAIALWDKKKEELKLARDRFGEKPMYYGWIKNAFYFGSELKPIKNNPYFNLEIDRNALTQFIKYSYIPQPLTIYKNIKKLKPGFILKVNAKKNILFEEYWSLNNLTKSTSKINMLGIDPDFTGMGLGKYLLYYTLKHQITNGQEKVILDVDSKNLKARKLYENFGFKQYLSLTWWEKKLD